MSVLTGPEITRLVNLNRAVIATGGLPPVPSIFIDPFLPSLCGPNSYDMHLSGEMRVYALSSVRRVHPELFTAYYGNAILPQGLDAREKPETVPFTIPEDGFWLHPGVLYLGATVERICCHGLTPWLDGRSSIGRIGLSIHVTAGRGDDGWRGRFTLEITAVAHPVKVYPNMRCGQLTFFTLVGDRKPYEGKYQDQDGPTASRLHQDADKK